MQKKGPLRKAVRIAIQLKEEINIFYPIKIELLNKYERSNL